MGDAVGHPALELEGRDDALHRRAGEPDLFGDLTERNNPFLGIAERAENRRSPLDYLNAGRPSTALLRGHAADTSGAQFTVRGPAPEAVPAGRGACMIPGFRFGVPRDRDRGEAGFTELHELVDPAHSALVVVDMQRDFCQPGGAFDRLGVDISMYPPVVPRIARRSRARAMRASR